MDVRNNIELRQAVKKREPEITVSEPVLVKKVRLLMGLRLAANVAVFAILVIAIFMWANPLGIGFLEAGSGRLLRQILLFIGILLLFADYLMPVARHYKITVRSEGQIKLTLRKPR